MQPGVNAFMREWSNGDLGGTLHPVWNSIALVAWLVALGLLLRIPASRFPRGRTSKILWAVSSGVLTVYVHGLGFR